MNQVASIIRFERAGVGLCPAGIGLEGSLGWWGEWRRRKVEGEEREGGMEGGRQHE